MYFKKKKKTLILSSIVSPYVYNVHNIIRRMLQRLMTKHHDKHRKCSLLHSIIHNTESPNLQVQKKKINTTIYKTKIINTCRRIQYKWKLCQSSMDGKDSSSLKLILRIIELVDYTFLDLLLVLTVRTFLGPRASYEGYWFMQAVTYDISCSSIESSWFTSDLHLQWE